jgi:hypothetical protein
MFFEIDFGRAQAVEGIRVMCRVAERNARVQIRGRLATGEWRMLAADPSTEYWVALNLRRRAAFYARREGFQYILPPAGKDGFGPVGRVLIDHPSDWGIETVDSAKGVYLLKIR